VDNDSEFLGNNDHVITGDEPLQDRCAADDHLLNDVNVHHEEPMIDEQPMPEQHMQVVDEVPNDVIDDEEIVESEESHSSGDEIDEVDADGNNINREDIFFQPLDVQRPIEAMNDLPQSVMKLITQYDEFAADEDEVHRHFKDVDVGKQGMNYEPFDSLAEVIVAIMYFWLGISTDKINVLLRYFIIQTSMQKICHHHGIS